MKPKLSTLLGIFLMAAILRCPLHATSVINFKSSIFEVNELDSVKSVTVTCTPPPPSGSNISAQLRIVGGTASGADFVFPHSGFDVVFWPGASEVTASIPVIDDGLPEGDETLLLQITDIRGDAVPGTLTDATVTIHNGAPILLWADNSSANEGAPAEFIVYRRGDTNVAVSVDYATTNGTALAGIDFVPQAGTLTLAPGEREKTVLIPLINNGQIDVARRFGVQLSNPSPNVEIGNDVNPSIAISDDEIPVYFDRQFQRRTAALTLPSGRVFRNPVPWVFPLTAQPDGKLITTHGGAVVRLNVDGSPDPAFAAAVTSRTDYAWVTQLALDRQGRLLVAGSFGAVNGTPRNGLARLLGDGALDLSFTPPTDWSPTLISLQADDRLLLYERGQLRRINGDGSWDASFASGLEWLRVGQIESLPDGKILVAGQGTNLTTFHLLRLDAGGQIDPTFHRPLLNQAIKDLYVQRDGAIVLVGDFDSVDGHRRTGVARLQPNGTLDLAFDPNLAVQGSVLTVAGDSRGRVLIGGGGREHGDVLDGFSEDPLLHGQLVRLNEDGTLDPIFGPCDLTRLIDQSDYPSSLHGQLPLGQASIYNLVPHQGRILVSGAVDSPSPEQSGPVRASVLLALYEEFPANSLEFTGDNFSPTDTEGIATITVKRIGDTSGLASVHYSTSDGTALAGVHYQPQAGVLTFAPMEVEKSFAIPLLRSSVSEPPRDLLVNLTDPSGVAVIGLNQARVRIFQDGSDAVGISIRSFCGLPSVELFGNPGAYFYDLSYAASLKPPFSWTWVTEDQLPFERVLRLDYWHFRDLGLDPQTGFFRLLGPP